MADLKITGLPPLVEAGVQNVDVLALADLSANETKKITVKDLVAAGVALIDDADIPGAKVGTLGTNQVAGGAIQDGAVTNVKLANSSISLGGVSIALGATDATPAFDLADATGYTTANLSGTITNAQLAGSIAGTKLLDTTIAYAKLNLSDGDIPGAKIATGGITATQLAVNSVTASELADDAVDTAAIADGAVVAASIATDTITANQIAPNAIGASELADNAVDAGAIAADAVTTVKILNANVTAAKLAANLPGTILATGAIGSTQLAANSVTASELADNAVDSGAIAASAVVDAKIASGIDGAKITDGTITAAKLATANIDRSLNVASGNLGINNTVVAATRSGITYNAQGLITGTVALAASDLPIATTSAVGAVSVGTGLAVTGAGALSLSNSVTAATISGITYNAQGQITATTALVAGDLPVATTSAKGAVQVTSGGGISVDGSGAISTSTSGVTAGTYGKVTVDVKGVVTSGGNLIAGDIPDLSATKITSGTFDVGRFGTNTITGVKFADSSVCQFTGAQSTSGVVTFPTAEFKGQFFYDLTNDDLYVYDGSAFQPVTITSGEIIYAGNYRADTNKITSLTAAGTAQGFTQNAALQAASAANNRYYFVCDKSGTGTSPAPTVTINPPDMILSNGNTWEKLDISNFIAGQVASNIGVTATGGIQNTNVQSVLEELDTEKLNLTGGLLTGNLSLNQSSSIIFEGSTPDDFETTLTVIDPTADRTVSLPNVTGTLVSTGDTGTVTSTMILDGTIVNADINASAAIALTKLANVTAAHIIVGNASNVPTAVAITGDISISNAGLVAITADSIVNADIKSDAAIAGSKIVAGTTSVVGVVQLEDSVSSASTTKAATPASVKTVNDALTTTTATADAAVAKAGSTMTGNLILGNAKQVRFSELTANGANYVSLQAPDTLAADVSYTLPSAAPTANGQVLASTTGGVLSWTEDPTGGWVTSGNDISYSAGDVTFTGASYNLVWDKSDNALEFGDNAKAIFGTGGDLELYFDDTDSYLYHKTGTTLIVKSDGGIALKTATSDDAIACNLNGSVELYWDGNKKFETEETGAKVTGNLTVTTGNNIQSNSSTGQLTIKGGAAYPGGAIKFAGGQSGATDRGTTIFYSGEATSLEERMRIDESGRFLLAKGTPDSTTSQFQIGEAAGGYTWDVGDVPQVLISGVNNEAPTSGTLNIALRIEDENANNMFQIHNRGGGNSDVGEVYIAGNVGIGEDSPGSLLHVKESDTSIAPHASAQICLEREGTNYLQFLTAETGTSGVLFGDGSDVDVAKIVYDHNVPSMQFYTETALAMTIDDDQDVGIGVTPSVRLDVGKSNAVAWSTSQLGCQGRIQNTATTDGAAAGLQLRVNNAAGAAAIQYIFAVGTTTNYKSDLVFATRTAASTYQEKLRVKNGGDVEITDGDLVVADTHGIDFSGASSGHAGVSSLVLDAYEEGTWTPNTANGPTRTKYQGHYTKVGDTVHAWFVFDFSGQTDGGSGHAYISNLPFNIINATANSPENGASCGAIAWGYLNYGSTLVSFFSRDTDDAYLYTEAGGTLPGSDLNGKYVEGCAIYKTAT